MAQSPSSPEPSDGRSASSREPESHPQQALYGRVGLPSDSQAGSSAASGSGGSGSVAAASLSTEDLLFEAMDRQARRFIDMLDDESKDEDGELKISIEMRFKLFDKGQDWLMKRSKLRPAGDATEGSGISDMRASMEDPAFMETLDKIMFERLGYVKTPPNRGGRPRNTDKPVRERFQAFKEGQTATQKAKDDSGWQKALSAAPPEGEA